MKIKIIATLLSVVLLQNVMAQAPEQPYQGVVGKTLGESKEYWIPPVKADSGAPNIVWIILDDV